MQQNKIINHIQEPGTYRGHHQFKGPRKSNFKEISFEIFYEKNARLSQDLTKNVVGSSFQIMGAATEKARLFKSYKKVLFKKVFR